ncbi:MAG TPA: IS630 family transposase [Nitrospiraceae bacterium]|nr:IS630 family transposase [Nitrospiraceae bacterium]
MKTGRPKPPLGLTPDEVAQLQRVVASRSIPQGFATRARMILLSDDGLSNAAIARKLGVTNATVGKWRRRFVTDRLAGLHDELRPGRPRTRTDEELAGLVQKTLRTKPKASTQWSCRTMEAATGISKSTVQRVWQLFGLQPHRQRTFKLSTDPFFVEKVRDIVGLYLNPPDKALVLCVDEKTQVQALNRTQPVLPLGLGYVEGVTHDYVRHGTTTLFAALDVATGTVISQCRRRHRHQEFLAFLRHVDTSVPQDLDIHLIIDNYATHKHPKVRTWLAMRPRYHVHYTPTYASWLNQVELWFRRISQQAIRRGSFQSVKELVAKIDHFVQTYNKTARPFAWTATADSILAKVRRLCERISGTQH